MKTPRDRTVGLLGTLVGVVLLGAMAVFAIVLPKVSADGASDLGSVELPAELPGGYVAIESGPEGIDPAQVEQITADDAYAADFIADQVGGEAASRQYVTDDLSAVASVQVYAAQSGPQVPAFIPDPEVRGQEQPTVEIVTAGDEDQVECVVSYATSDPTTGQPLPEPQVQGATCQETAEGVTVRVQLFGTQGALPVPEGAEAVDPAVEITESLWDSIV